MSDDDLTDVSTDFFGGFWLDLGLDWALRLIYLGAFF
jgi:hypothetical protein